MVQIRLLPKFSLIVSLLFSTGFSASWADKIPIPDIKTKLSDDFLVKTIASIDDVLEDLHYREKTKNYDNVAYGIAATSYAAFGVSKVLEALSIETKVLGPVANGVSDARSVGKTGNRIRNILEGWLSGSIVVQTTTSNTENVLEISKEDFHAFREVLKEIRDKEYAILLERRKFSPKVDAEILRNRPSYLELYIPCVKSVATFREQMLKKVYYGTIMGYVEIMSTDTHALSESLQSGWNAPLLSSLLRKDVFHPAIKSCFASAYYGIDTDEEAEFVKQLLAAEWAARSTLVVGADLGLNYAIKAANSPIGKSAMALLKKSPGYFKRGLSLATAGFSVYALKGLWNQYQVENDVNIPRYSKDDFKQMGAAYMNERIQDRIEDVDALMCEPLVFEDEYEKLRASKADWQKLLEEFPAPKRKFN